MKSVKQVQIVIKDDDNSKSRKERIIFEVNRSVKRAIEFLKEFGISVNQEALYHLWRVPEVSKSEISFEIDPRYHEKLMNLCPVSKKLPLNEALDNESVHIGILPLMD